jgi:hypothetical protein
MATPATQFSLEHHLLDRLKFSGIEKENLADLVSIVMSLRNKYGITPVVVSPRGMPVPDSVVARYVLEPTTLNKLPNILLDTPRLSSLTALPHGLPQPAKFEVNITIGG